MSDKLKPCPFCGAEDPAIECNGKWYYVACRKCDCISDGDLGQSGAVERWNTRPIEDDLRRQLEQARAALAGVMLIADDMTGNANDRLARISRRCHQELYPELYAALEGGNT